MSPSSFFCIPVYRSSNYKNCLFTRQHRRRQNKDIISDLSDCLLIHILSFLNAKEAVQTCILSKRWIFLWKSHPNLTLSSSLFRFPPNLNEFLSQILSLRDVSTSIHTLNLSYQHNLELSLLQRIIQYAVSHNVQHLLLDYSCYIEYFPSCFFSSHTLTSLHLSAHKSYIFSIHKPKFPNSLNWPALTTLYLKGFAFAPSHYDCVSVDPFSGLKVLNTLTIDNCIVLAAQNLCISSVKLVNLSILMWPFKCFNFGIELCTPSLHTLTLTGHYTPNIFGSKSVLSSIKQVSIDLSSYLPDPILLNLLVKLANIESLAFYSHTLEVLSSVPDLLKAEFHSLRNLKSLKTTIPSYHSSTITPYMKVAFLIKNSRSAKVEMISL
ncbi:unnamed protein product [Trifolium pratense]|uniref:Uncharacterized protein n=1 Tax=Trifolium pratense TaxID=57577 RepID=A0ACB0JYD3_TRIPR|nr:unnamed protein product [Trifolium pratense]